MTLPALAERLEELLPQTMATLFRSEGADPLRHHSVGQIRLMRVLIDGSMTASELAHLLGLSPSSLTQMASRMIAAGLISKSSADGDRRVRRLSLTEAGRELMQRRRGTRAEAASRVLAKLDIDKVKRLISLLEEIEATSARGRQSTLEAAV